MTTKTAQFTPPDCPICRERHEANRSLSYDGRGINSCGMYRNRIATFQHSDDVARELGPKFAAAPAMYAALREAEKHLTDLANYGAEGIPEPLLVSVRSAIAQAEGQHHE